ncbi:MAG: hypothetical protein LBC57_10860 [Treponema sp.]|nr:hypothetical protein [Treponema sp.]
MKIDPASKQYRVLKENLTGWLYVMPALLPLLRDPKFYQVLQNTLMNKGLE